MNREVIKLPALAAAGDNLDAFALIAEGAIVELPDGSRWKRFVVGDDEGHTDSVRASEFKAKNNGVSMTEAQDADLVATQKGLPPPYFNWHSDMEIHDVFFEIGGTGRYCSICGSAYVTPEGDESALPPI